MANAEDEQAIIFDFANQPVVSNAIFPECPEARTVQRFSDASRIIQLGNSLLKKPENTSAVLCVKPA